MSRKIARGYRKRLKKLPYPPNTEIWEVFYWTLNERRARVTKKIRINVRSISALIISGRQGGPRRSRS